MRPLFLKPCRNFLSIFHEAWSSVRDRNHAPKNSCDQPHFSYCHAAVMEAGSLLPEDDAELDGWIGKAVEEHDFGGFTYLVLPAMHLGRKVASRHIEGGMQLLPNPNSCGCVIWNLDGDDVPERVLAGLSRGGVSPETQAHAYLVVWQWCVERRDGRIPAEYRASMRDFCRYFNWPQPIKLVLSVTAAGLKDEPMLASLDTTLAAMHSDLVADAALKLVDTYLKIAKVSILELIPTEPALNHTGFTMRRSVERIGRNDACPCESGKKYKRCCFEKDRQRLSQSSDVAGKTRAEVWEAPAEFLSAARLDRLRPYEMARLDPLEIDGELLEPYLIRLGQYGMYEEAATAFEKLGWSGEISVAWLSVMRAATHADRKDIADRLMKVRGEVTPMMDTLFPSTRLLLVKDDPAASLKLLEELAMEALHTTDPDELSNVAFGIQNSIVPALGILVARGMIPMVSPKTAIPILQDIIASRIQLELPDDEPYSDILEMILATRSAASGKKNAEALRIANQKLEAKAGEVRKMKQSIEDLKHEIERREGPLFHLLEETRRWQPWTSTRCRICAPR